jgi:exodeoxyribonuclease VII small subunit
MKNETFESALLKLEAIIKELESGDIDLDKSIDKYKEATKLLNLCDEKLKSATKTVNKVLNDSGEFEDFKVEEE